MNKEQILLLVFSAVWFGVGLLFGSAITDWMHHRKEYKAWKKDYAERVAANEEILKLKNKYKNGNSSI